MISFLHFLGEETLPDKTGHYTLYHGTSGEDAKKLMKNGWTPGQHGSGGQCGSPKHLYLTNHPENARWYADQKHNGTVLKVRVHKDHLKVDPEDGIADTVHHELNSKHGLPGNVAAHKPIPTNHFRLHR